MLATLTWLVSIFFAGMGILALAAPERITSIFGTTNLSAAGRNEVRAVYGGFGLAIAGILFAAPSLPGVARGVYITVALALAGMAAGRVISAAVERPPLYPSWFYCAVETAMAIILFATARALPA